MDLQSVQRFKFGFCVKGIWHYEMWLCTFDEMLEHMASLARYFQPDKMSVKVVSLPRSE